MKREMLPLVRMARRGDVTAMLVVGQGYLRGQAPFCHQPETGIRYLARSADAGCAEAVDELVNSLSLEQLVRHGLLSQLRHAAARGLPAAQYKLGLWLMTEFDERPNGVYWLRCAANAGMPQARVALANALAEDPSLGGASEALRLLRAESLAGNPGAWAPLARAALDAGDTALFAHALARACTASDEMDGVLAALVLEALLMERRDGLSPVGCPPSQLRAALESRVHGGDARAMLFLGRAISGLDEDLRRRAEISTQRKLGHAVTLLTNAANAGQCEGWIALADLYARQPRLPFGASSHRYCLERAATAGSSEAAVRLGGLLLKTAKTEQDLQRAMELLHGPAHSGNADARALLASLVLRVAGDAGAAESALALISTRNALLAARLALAREFGLTQHEALTIDVRRAVRGDCGSIPAGSFASGASPPRALFRRRQAVPRQRCNEPGPRSPTWIRVPSDPKGTIGRASTPCARCSSGCGCTGPCSSRSAACARSTRCGAARRKRHAPSCTRPWSILERLPLQDRSPATSPLGIAAAALSSSSMKSADNGNQGRTR